MKRIAVVILNWNGKDFLKKFLPSVLSSCNADVDVAYTIEAETDVIVADNGSSDASLDIFNEITANFLSSSKLLQSCGKRAESTSRSKVRWIQLNKNYGFTGGYNRALDKLKENIEYKYDYYILLNSDVYTPKGWLAPLISFMETHPQVCVCQPKVLAYSGSRYDHSEDGEVEYVAAHDDSVLAAVSSDVFEYAGASGGFIDKYGFPFCRGRILSEIEKDRGQYDTPIRTFWATGACMVVRSSLWEELEGFDEEFFAHMEEIDFCWRAALLGHQIWTIPQSAVYHVGGGTLPNNSPQKLFYNYRNNLLMLRKNLPPCSVSGKIFLRKIIDGLSALAYCFKFKFKFAGAVLKAHRDYNKRKHTIKPSPRSDEANRTTGRRHYIQL